MGRVQIILKNQTSYRHQNNRHVDCGPLNERRKRTESTRQIQLYYERPLFLDSVPCASQLQTAPRVINIFLTTALTTATKIFYTKFPIISPSQCAKSCNRHTLLGVNRICFVQVTLQLVNFFAHCKLVV